jgi:DNA-binding IclR family transcriptional regulator
MEEKINKSIDKALQILELFSMEKPAWGITEISKALNMYKSNVYNILFTLAERGFIKKDPNTEKYSLSIKYFELGSIVIKNMDLRKIAHPYIEELSKEFNETVHLGVLDKGRVVSIEREESDKSLCSHIEIGKRTPLHCTAVGKAIMAYLSEDEINLIIKEKGLKKFTENTITTKKDLENEFKKIREQGYAVSGPAFRINESNIPNIAKKVKEYCDYISKEMGYNFDQKKY